MRPRENSMLMMTMSYADEINPTADLRELGRPEGELDERELEVARRLVDSIAEPFEIDQATKTPTARPCST